MNAEAAGDGRNRFRNRRPRVKDGLVVHDLAVGGVPVEPLHSPSETLTFYSYIFVILHLQPTEASAKSTLSSVCLSH